MAKDLLSFDLNCKSAGISPNGHSSVTLTLEDVDRSDLMELIEPDEYIDYIGIDKLLKEIGEEEAKKYFNLE